ncbi:peptidylprolyl isomerase [Luteolibacter marinus]|uniref:peptidylprolyl isomerase n=1 Tax=Luteolibacter marinus TaxID=2776705 RepID=UPI001866B378|nr:peptidylprolyl isomerase [Luteolibacter marinus]
MIENLRKYTGLIIFVVALLFVGLAFFGNGSSAGQGNPGDPPAVKIDGRTYTYTEFQKGSSATIRLAMELGLYQFVSKLGGFGPEGDETNQRFFANHLFLKQAREEFGVHPSDEEVTAALKAMPAFQDNTTRQYDQARYNLLVTQGIGRLGMTESDVLELVRDNIASAKLEEIIGGGLAADRTTAADQVASNDQQVTIQFARTSLEKFKEEIQPTDEELLAAWETTKDKYQTDRKIKVTYFIAKPVYPEPEKEEATLPQAVTEEDKKAEAEEAKNKKDIADAKLAGEKKEIDGKFADLVDAFLSELDSSEGAAFESLAGENKWEITTTELFPRSAVPAALSINKNSATDPTPVADLLFQLVLESEQPLAKFTDAVPVADGGYLIARLDEIEEARTKTFDEAKDLVKADYISEKSAEALKTDADEKTAKIREAVTGGKTFADAAKELGLEVKSHGPFKRTDQLDGEADTAILFDTASMVAPGSLADPVLRPDGALLVFVEKRELVKDPARDSRVEQTLTALTSSQKTTAFAAWLNEKLENTVIENLLR